MRRLETGELRADDEFILEEQRKTALIDEAFNRFRGKVIASKIAGLTYGQDDWELMFYDKAIKEAIDIANELTKIKVKVIENVVVQLQVCTRERPLIGGICLGSQRCQNAGACPCATIGWVANKPGFSRGIVTVEHAVNVNEWVSNNQCIIADRMATTETTVNDNFVDASYSHFNAGIDGSPSIKNLGDVIGWFGYDSVLIPLNVSFNGFGGARVNTQVTRKGNFAGKSRQIVIQPVTQGGDSGTAYANFNPDTGGWVLVGLHRAMITVNGVPFESGGSAIDEVNTRTGTYPYLA